MKKLLLLLLLLTMGVVSATDAPKVDTVLRPAAESYTDETTKLVFPSQLGAFFKTQVTKNQNPVFGTTIRYLSEDSACADVYLYRLDTKGMPVTERELKEEFKTVSKVILSMKGRSEHISSVTFVAVDEPQPDGVLLAKFDVTIQKEPVTSYLIMFLVRDTIVKCRITCDPSQVAESVGFYQELLKMAGFKLPGK